ncbi:uncharacterized protein PAC_14677 [Phialocephala subalpina]|uniref:Uncharacterized protein n=1 Tax=Phialocephala subalpina TaxID=576137 RepID=A0A1L7XID2_9HELO|nr:uncharacterized protein PAC_14677 [Phialocephala subalpina]
MSGSTLSTTLLYTAGFLASATVAGHTKMGFDLVFPALKKAPDSPGTRAAKIGWMECNQGFVFMTLFCIKWANTGGLTDTYDKAFLGIYSAAQIWTGIAYIKAGIYEPLVPLWGIPTLAGAGLLL